jgi:hypothetical protein
MPLYVMRPQPWATRAFDNWTRFVWHGGRWFVFGGCLFWRFFVYLAAIWYGVKFVVWAGGLALIVVAQALAAGWDLATYPHKKSLAGR